MLCLAFSAYHTYPAAYRLAAWLCHIRYTADCETVKIPKTTLVGRVYGDQHIAVFIDRPAVENETRRVAQDALAVRREGAVAGIEKFNFRAVDAE